MVPRFIPLNSHTLPLARAGRLAAGATRPPAAERPRRGGVVWGRHNKVRTGAVALGGAGAAPALTMPTGPELRTFFDEVADFLGADFLGEAAATRPGAAETVRPLSPEPELTVPADRAEALGLPTRGRPRVMQLSRSGHELF